MIWRHESNRSSTVFCSQQAEPLTIESHIELQILKPEVARFVFFIGDDYRVAIEKSDDRTPCQI